MQKMTAVRLILTLAFSVILSTSAQSSDFAIDKDISVDVWRAEEAEDASSSFYYFGFYHRGDDTAKKIRILWNGGAQNKPTTTDYYVVSSSKWLVVERTYNRKDLQSLLFGETPDSQPPKTRDLDLTKKPMTEQILSDLKNLFHASSMRQRPLP